MIKERADELVAALRSGDYQQGKHLLCRLLDDGTKLWCCLGVACDLTVKAMAGDAPPVRGVEVADEGSDYPWVDEGRTYHKIEFNGRDGLLPDAVVDYFGFGSDNGTGGPGMELYSGNETLSLAGMNDGGASFTQIADYIELHWAKL